MSKLKFSVFCVLFISALSGYASHGLAQVDGCTSEISHTCTPDPMRLNLCPAGDWDLISEGCGGTDDRIDVWARNWLHEGVEGVPPTDFWLGACDPAAELCVCENGFLADAPTDENGYTCFSNSIFAGGCVLGGGIYIAIQGHLVMDWPECVETTCLDVIIKSADYNGDCDVNLTDLAHLAGSYNRCAGEPDFNPCCDSNDDDCVNLSDFAWLGAHWHHHCP